MLVPDSHNLVELWQAEWCPHSHRVRLRLTELGIPFVARQVSVDRAERQLLEQQTGSSSIPTFVDGATIVSGAEEILAHLDAAFDEPADAQRHRAMMSEEWPHWVAQHS